MFTKITESKKAGVIYQSQFPDNTLIQPAAALLAEKHLPQLLSRLPALANVPAHYYQALYYKLIENTAEYMQQLPAIGDSAYEYAGGFLEFALERAFLTLHLYRKEHPIGDVTPEQMPAKTALWSYALFSAALLLGIGKIPINCKISLCDQNGRNALAWNPYEGSLWAVKKQNTHYRYSLNTAVNWDNLAGNTTLYIARQLLPEEAFYWLASDNETFEAWQSLLLNNERRGGVLAKVVLFSQFHLLSPNRSESDLLAMLVKEGLLQKDVLYTQKQTQPNQNEKPKTTARSGTATGVDFSNFQSPDAGKIFAVWLGAEIDNQRIAINRGKDGLVNIGKDGKVFVTQELIQKFLKENAYLQKTAQDILRVLVSQGNAISDLTSRSNYFETAPVSTAKLMSGNNASTPNNPNRIVAALDATLIFPGAQIPPPAINLNVVAFAEKNLPPLLSKEPLSPSPTPRLKR